MTGVKCRAVFLDRDGTLIEDTGYLGEPAAVVLLPGVAEALVRLRAAGFVTVVVSNQSGVARGYFGTDAVHSVNQRMSALLQAAHPDARIDAVYFCPHGPADGCSCRKPQPGLFLQAAQELALCLPDSICFGDSERDLVAGRAAGCYRAERVGTTAPSLLDAVSDFLNRERPPC